MHCTELIQEHEDHWFEMDIVRDKRVQELLEQVEGPPLDDNPTPSVGGDRIRRAGTAYNQMLWPDARVPYLFDGFVGRAFKFQPCG